MSSRAGDGLAQAERDLRHARNSLEDGDFEWCCFAAQQAAEKAVKALFQALGGEARGHVIRELLEALPDSAGWSARAGPGLLDVARRLDKHYIQPRYPNGFASGYPGQHYSREEAEQAIADGTCVYELCKGVMVRSGEGPRPAP